MLTPIGYWKWWRSLPGQEKFVVAELAFLAILIPLDIILLIFK